ncbi:MAG: hypothetical protein KDA89_15370, partial [Planctomycetaceae bacterium]|nr:hypothetical protein [Planctomycetaceae bacterium]
WQVSTNGGANFTDISGETNLTLSFVAAQTDDSYQYRALFSNLDASNVPTSAATLTLTEVPSLVVTTLDDVVNNTDHLTSLREAILFANASPGADTITFAPGIAGGTVTLSIAGAGEHVGRTGDLDITSEITIDAAGTTIDAAGIDRVLDVHGNARLTLNDVTITGGVASDGGGILINPNIVVTVNRSTISGNRAVGSGFGTVGGGLHVQGILELNDSIVSGNTSGHFGGGIYAFSPAVLTVTGSTISGNTARAAGGIELIESSATIINSTISDNHATDLEGGGLTVGLATLNLVSSTVTGNTSPSGAGISILISGTTVNVINSTISGNMAVGSGGGIDNLDTGGIVNLTNSTIVGNSANDGGGLHGGTGGGTIANSIITGNTATNASDVAGTITSNGHNVIGDASGSTGFGGGDNIGTPASQVLDLTLANNGGPTQTHALVFGLTNPAINRGVVNVGITTDQRGVLRPFGAVGDIGAFESQFPIPSVNPQDQTVNTGDMVTFTALADGLFAGSAPSTLTNDAQLLPGEFLLSPNHGYKLAYQTDGDLVLYRGDGVAIWNAGTFGQTPGRTVMHSDGNFVIYGPGDVVQFQTATSGNPGAVLSLQNDGNLVITGGSGIIFDTNAASPGPSVVPNVQWQVSTDGGANFNNINGKTDLNLSFIATSTDDQNQYRAVFSNIHVNNVPTAAGSLTINKIPVNLSVSTGSGTEAERTIITVTATADAAVFGDQFVTLNIIGTGITIGDYTLTDDDPGTVGVQIQIPDGMTTGSVTFTVQDDTDIEGPETATLTISNPSAGLVLGTSNVQDIAITDNDNIDFGDAADIYPVTLAEDGARHVATGPTLGGSRDSESDGVHSTDATADGADEDGVVTAGAVVPGGSADFRITASAAGFVNAWADFTRNGSFGDANEQFLINFPVTAGVNTYRLPIPSDFLPGSVTVRFRLTSSSVATPLPTGLLPDGEVEDYVLTISDTARILDNGDTGYVQTGLNTHSGYGFNGDVNFAYRGQLSGFASWTFDGLQSGEYQISATWAAHPNRSTSAPFTIRDGVTNVATADADQTHA